MSIQTALHELQTAIYDRLSSDPAVLAKVEGVFDGVDEDQAFPYITIDEPVALPFRTKQKYGENLSIVIHAWSEMDGNKEAVEILNTCLNSLRFRLSLPGFAIKEVEPDDIRVIRDPNPRIRNGVLRMKYTIQKN